MRHLSLALFLTLPLFQLPLFSQVITDNKVVIQTTYEIGDQSVYELKTLIEDTNDGNTTTETNTYDLKITVTDTITGNYKIRMDCSNWKTQSATKATDLSLRELGSSIPYSYQINPSGTFVNTDGSTNLRTTIHTLLDKYIAEKGEAMPDSISNMLKKNMLSMSEAEVQGNYWAQDMNSYHFFYGVQLERNKPLEVTNHYPHGVVKIQMPTKQITRVMKVDDKNSLIHLRMETGISAEDSQKLSYEFLKEQFNALGIENIIELKMENIPYMQVSEQLDFIFDIATGRLVDGTYQKLEELGDSSKLKTVEFRLKE